MSNKERAIQLLERISEWKMIYVIGLLAGGGNPGQNPERGDNSGNGGTGKRWRSVQRLYR